ncbi:MaoC/PaaZ C-terminal domain-containing protein [bacterium]|nr:MaoC/PaaZ C-terminal domain-containing protein [bacterium]
MADFALLTGDHDPLHEDGGMASPFGEPVAHGLLGLSVLAGLSSSRPDVATLALVAISDWHFESPVRRTRSRISIANRCSARKTSRRLTCPTNLFPRKTGNRRYGVC